MSSCRQCQSVGFLPRSGVERLVLMMPAAVFSPLIASRRRTYLPVDLTAKEGVSQEALYRGEESDGLANVIFSIASNAKVSLCKLHRCSRARKGAGRVFSSLQLLVTPEGPLTLCRWSLDNCQHGLQPETHIREVRLLIVCYGLIIWSFCVHRND